MPENPTPDVFAFFNEIGIIEQLSRNRAEKRFADGLKISQFAVLNHLIRVTPQASPAQLASAFQVTRAAMTNTMKRLVDLEYITVSPDPEDGRGKVVSLTDTGRDAHARAVAALRDDFQACVDALGARGFTDALPFLRAVRVYLDEHR